MSNCVLFYLVVSSFGTKAWYLPRFLWCLQGQMTYLRFILKILFISSRPNIQFLMVWFSFWHQMKYSPVKKKFTRASVCYKMTVIRPYKCCHALSHLIVSSWRLNLFKCNFTCSLLLPLKFQINLGTLITVGMEIFCKTSEGA